MTVCLNYLYKKSLLMHQIRCRNKEKDVMMRKYECIHQTTLTKAANIWQEPTMYKTTWKRLSQKQVTTAANVASDEKAWTAYKSLSNVYHKPPKHHNTVSVVIKILSLNPYDPASSSYRDVQTVSGACSPSLSLYLFTIYYLLLQFMFYH